MSKSNAVKLIKITEEGEHFGSGYYFASECGSKSFVLTAKHAICAYVDTCEYFNSSKLDACRKCCKTQGVEGLEIKCSDTNLSAKDIFISPEQDIAIIEVNQKASNKLSIVKAIDGSCFYAYGFKGNKSESGRFILNEPDCSNDFVTLNICSNPITELEEKSQSLYGVSGALVYKVDGVRILACAVITNNEMNNDLGAEAITKTFNLLAEKYFSVKVFSSAYRKELNLSSLSNINDCFSMVHNHFSGDFYSAEVLVPNKTGLPFFDFTDVIDELSESFYRVLGDRSKLGSMRIVSAMNVMSNSKEHEPVNKLLTSRIVESFLSAPHLYSTTVDCKEYYNLHVRPIDEQVEYIYSSYNGSGELSVNIIESVHNVFNSINSFSYKLFESQHLNKDFTDEECEALFHMIFEGDENKFKSVAVLCSFTLENIKKRPECVRTYIVEQAKIALEATNDFIMSKELYGVKLYLYILPLNRTGEIVELLEVALANA